MDNFWFKCQREITVKHKAKLSNNFLDPLTLSFLYFILWHFWSFSGMKNNAMYLWIILSCAEGGGSIVEFQGCGEVTLVKVFSSVVLQAKERDIVEGTF